MSSTDKRVIFGEVYDELADSLYRHCFFRVNDKEKAEDIVQETFMKFWRELHKGVDITYPKAWVFRSARNSIIDHYRKKKSDSLDIKIEDGFDPHNEHDHIEISDKAEISLVMEKMQDLDDVDREVLLLRYVDDLPMSDIAHVMDSTTNAVTVRVHRAVEKLRVKIGAKK